MILAIQNDSGQARMILGKPECFWANYEASDGPGPRASGLLVRPWPPFFGRQAPVLGNTILIDLRNGPLILT